jgi:hypothetical protein
MREPAAIWSPCMPGGSRIDLFPSAPAASETKAYRGNRNRLGQRVHVHVCSVTTRLTGRDNGMDAILAHVC